MCGVCARESKKNTSLFSPVSVFCAYLDCRKRKRTTHNAIRFESRLCDELLSLEEKLHKKTYVPSRSVCFVTEGSKPREIFAADFRDRVVHHLLVRPLEKQWERVFIHDSFACRKDKGTHAAVRRLQDFTRCAGRNGKVLAWYLKLDILNFFMTIDRNILYEILCSRRRCPADPDILWLLMVTLFHDPTEKYVRRSPFHAWKSVPFQKSLFNAGQDKGLPIGNLTSQFFANVYLNELDQYIKHALKVRYYLRYVDDMVFLSNDKDECNAIKKKIEDFLHSRLKLRLNENATRLLQVSKGIDFLGYIVRPGYVLVRRRVAERFRNKLKEYERLLLHEHSGWITFQYPRELCKKLLACINSYMAHFAKADGHRLMERIIHEFTFLQYYIRFIKNKAVQQNKPPGDFSTLHSQYQFFISAYPGEMIFFQTGRYCEMYDEQALSAQKIFGLRSITPRNGFFHRVGFQKTQCKIYLEKAQERGVDVAVVEQTGKPLLHVEERNVVLRMKRRVS